MKKFAAIIAGSVLTTAGMVRADQATSLARHPDKEDSYTITSIIQILKPVNVADMNDDFQDARVIVQDKDACTVEVTYYPLYRPAVGENGNWRKEDAGMTEYLKPTASENWDEAMRQELLAELRSAGIEPDKLTDKELVEKVSAWAMHRAHSTEAFSIWSVSYAGGKPSVYPALRAAFEGQKPKPDWTDEQMFEEEALGREMFFKKVHGSCTSSAIYMATILRALGIPTRIVFCIPPFDPNDATQAKMFYDNVHHNQTRETVRSALDGMRGFDNHVFNEVYVGRHWVRLNYKTLGQPVVDAHYFGLLTHIYTCASLSEAALPETWGMRYFKYPAGQLRLSSVNPYQLISVRDHFGTHAQVDNPELPVKELRTVTITGLRRTDDPGLPAWVSDFLKGHANAADFLILTKEWLPDVKDQMRTYYQRAGHDFVMTSPGHADVRARLTGLRQSDGHGTFQAYAASVAEGDRSKLAAGAEYKIQPKNMSDTYQWTVAPDLKGIKLKE